MIPVPPCDAATYPVAAALVRQYPGSSVEYARCTAWPWELGGERAPLRVVLIVGRDDDGDPVRVDVTWRCRPYLARGMRTVVRSAPASLTVGVYRSGGVSVRAACVLPERNG